MNKERSSLLIALSMIIVFTIITFLTGAGVVKPVAKAEVSSQITVKADLIATSTLEPLTSTTTVEGTIEEEIVEEPAAADSIAEQVWNAMKAKGWSDNVCAAILGNMMAECGGNTLELNPYAGGDSGTSFGLCQWHAGRKNSMLKFNGQNYNTKDNLPTIEHQIDYLEYELQNYNFLNSDKNYEELAYDFCVKFERPANKYKKGKYRQQLAEIAYQEFAI